MILNSHLCKTHNLKAKFLCTFNMLYLLFMIVVYVIDVMYFIYDCCIFYL